MPHNYPLNTIRGKLQNTAFPESLRGELVEELRKRAAEVDGRTYFLCPEGVGRDGFIPQAILNEHYKPTLKRLYSHLANELETDSKLTSLTTREFAMHAQQLIDMELQPDNLLVGYSANPSSDSLESNLTGVDITTPQGQAKAAKFSAPTKVVNDAVGLFTGVLEKSLGSPDYHYRLDFIHGLIRDVSQPLGNPSFKEKFIDHTTPGIAALIHANVTPIRSAVIRDRITADLEIANEMGTDVHQAYMQSLMRALQTQLTGTQVMNIVQTFDRGNDVPTLKPVAVYDETQRDFASSRGIGEKKFAEFNEKREAWYKLLAEKIGIEYQPPAREQAK